MRYKVFDFVGTGGVALAMFNTDAVRVLYSFSFCYFIVKDLYQNLIVIITVKVNIMMTYLKWQQIISD